MKKSLYAWCIENDNSILLKEWDQEKNQTLTPTDITYGSEKNIWWICSKCNYEWQSKCCQRTNGSGCPKCSKEEQAKNTIKTKIKRYGSLHEKRPDLSLEWDYEKNKQSPSEVCAGSNAFAWWICSVCKNHYQSRISSRNHGSDCPLCKSKKITRTRISKNGSLFDVKPELENEWNQSKNCYASIKDITANSDKKYWWKCDRGHEWQAAASTRNKGHGCPYCSGFYPTENSNLEITNPELAKQWHPTKNGDIKPNMISPFSMKKVWWKCDRGHEWQASVSNRNQGRGCSECSAELKSSFPEQAIVYYLSKHLTVLSRKVIYGWEVDIYLPDQNIGIEYDGIAYHSKDFHVEREKRKNSDLEKAGLNLIRIKESYKNDGIEDSTIYFIVDQKYSNLNLAIQRLISLLLNKFKIIISEPIDVNLDRIEILSQYIQREKNNSFAKQYPELVVIWNYKRNGGLTPENFTSMSNRKVWWVCPVCNGEWEESIINVSKGNRCPYCSNHKVLAGFNDLQTRNPILALEWDISKNEPLLPSQLTSGSGQKVWWKCKNGHEWRATVIRRTNNPECPYCNNTAKVIPLRDDDWRRKYEFAKEYFGQNGNLEVQAIYVCDNGFKLGSWIRTQRVSYKNGDLAEERKALLESIGMAWQTQRGTKRKSD